MDTRTWERECVCVCVCLCALCGAHPQLELAESVALERGGACEAAAGAAEREPEVAADAEVQLAAHANAHAEIRPQRLPAARVLQLLREPRRVDRSARTARRRRTRRRLLCTVRAPLMSSLTTQNARSQFSSLIAAIVIPDFD